MATPVNVRTLSTDECWEALRSTTFGRLAYHLRGRTLIAPINYAVDDARRLVFRTAEGSKFYALKVDDAVAFEIDEYDDTMARSVVAQGRVSEILADGELTEATLKLRPWVRSEKRHVLAIKVHELTGREFLLVPPDQR